MALTRMHKSKMIPFDSKTMRYEIAVVRNAIDLLLAMGASSSAEISVTEASRVLGVSRSTAYRLLVTLQGRHFVEHDALNNRWLLGSRLFALTRGGTLAKLKAVARPAMVRLLQEYRETVNLATLVERELIYVDILESPQPFRMTAAPGAVAPLHSTALGKSVLAAYPAEQRQHILRELKLYPLTEKTMIDRKRLITDLNAAANRGWAEEHGETERGVVCIGAAVLDAAGTPTAAISVSIPEVRLTPERTSKIGKHLAAEAGALSKALGYTRLSMQ